LLALLLDIFTVVSRFTELFRRRMGKPFVKGTPADQIPTLLQTLEGLA
jgi:hypothetical protein